MNELKELLQLLDAEIGILQRKLSVLQEIAQCIRQGQMDDLEELVQRGAELERRGESVESEMRDVCVRIAASCGMAPDEVTIGGLSEVLDGPDAIALQDRRERLVLVVQELRDVAAVTSLLVRTALDINERLLTAILGPEDEGETYCPEGALVRERQGTTFQHSV